MKEKSNPVVVGNATWADTIPEWLFDEIKAERLLYGLASITNGDRTRVGNAEVTAYLYTASLGAPLSHEYTNIYLYLSSQLMKKRGKDIPEEIKQGELTNYEKHCLEELKAHIYRRRGGEINHPLLNVMRDLKKEAKKKQKVRSGKAQLTLFH